MLKGEGTIEIVTRERVRRGCDHCGEPSSYRNTYLMPNARTNPASRAYRGDDVTWCSDHDQYLCGDCQQTNKSAGVPEDYEWCATFGIGDRFAHMFLEWRERGKEVREPAGALGAAADVEGAPV